MKHSHTIPTPHHNLTPVHYYGYTLIEVLVALMVFSILTATTSYTLYNTFHTKKLVSLQSDQLNELQLAILILQRDLKQIIERSSYGNDMAFYPPFIGNSDYIEFTRDGVMNPDRHPNSNLRRIAYLCKNKQLIRQQWQRVDTPNRNKDYSKRILLKNLDHCSFAFLSKNLEILNIWRAARVQENQQKAVLPLGIKFNFIVPNWGKLNLIFSVPVSQNSLKNV